MADTSAWADQATDIAKRAGFTEFHVAAAVSPAEIAARYAASGDAASAIDAQVRTNKAQATSEALAARASTAATSSAAVLASQALANQSGRDAAQARAVAAAQRAGAKAGVAAYKNARVASTSAAGMRNDLTLGNGEGMNARGKYQLSVARANGYSNLGAANYDTSWKGDANLSAARNTALATAKSYLGTGYVLGGLSSKGIDCSGLVMKVYQQLGFKVPTHSAADQGQTGGRHNGNGMPGTRVAWGSKQLQPGDLVAWKDGSHIAIYAGGGQIIEAANTKVGTVQRQLWASPGAVVGIHLNI